MNEFDGPAVQTSPAKWPIIAIMSASAVGALLYRLLTHQHLEQTAALFIGLPTVLAIALALQPEARTVTGAILRGITFMLLILAPLLGEGFVCILFAAPLFYLVGIVVGVIADRMRERRRTSLSCVAIVMLPMCLEGVVPPLTFSRTQVVTVRRVVDGSAKDVERRLALPPNLAAPLPAYLRIGFPRPLSATGSGLAPGAMRVIRFSGAEGKPPGDLRMRIAENRPGYVRFEALDDSSKLAHWLAWDASEVEWAAVDAEHTAITWRIRFARQLDPAWYFIPLERAAVHEAASYLIDANATPVSQP